MLFYEGKQRATNCRIVELCSADMCCFIDMTRRAEEIVHSIHLISLQTTRQPREICCEYTHPNTCSRLRETIGCFVGA